MFVSLGHWGTLIEKLEKKAATSLKTRQCLYFLKKIKKLAEVIQPANSYLWL